MSMEDKYQKFLKFLFDREESQEDWRFDYELEEPRLTESEVILFVRRMLENYESDIAQYSDWQLGKGVDYIFNNSCSDISFVIRDGKIPVEEKVSVILALKVFFKKCLNERCVPSLGHLSEEGNELNHFCYMVWDTTPLTYCEQSSSKDEIYRAVAEVMEYSLTLSNVACIESGLHGLGHLHGYFENASKIVRNYIKKSSVTDSRLIKYAKNAEIGYVQ
ncbi:hypothetical protein [Motilimonas sp. E26]|uniref:hypothetical protein n=1 Tax=Motilimonas sp. E26 TaxID=2865674 RepID=UPI001E32503A|nr:hypothetical protein [Motilimonas sp. E26]MCE0558789.1 hypothetical protein [Motilimonas sp. E26]